MAHLLLSALSWFKEAPFLLVGLAKGTPDALSSWLDIAIQEQRSTYLSVGRSSLLTSSWFWSTIYTVRSLKHHIQLQPWTSKKKQISKVNLLHKKIPWETQLPTASASASVPRLHLGMQPETSGKMRLLGGDFLYAEAMDVGRFGM